MEEIDQLADEGPQTGHGALASLAEHGLEASEGLLDRVEVGAVGRQKHQAGTSGFDQQANAVALVAG